ncbi:MAG: DUF4340 domain-containing protein [Terriglobales bacterium]
MKFRGLILATVVLAALCGTLYWSNHRKPTETKVDSADLTAAILTLNPADVGQVTINRKGADAIVLVQETNDKEKPGSGGTWRITAPKAFRADQRAVSATVATLTSLFSQRLVEASAKATDLGPYGLSDPPLEVDVSAKGKTYKLLIGDNTPTNNGAYARLEGDSRVFTIASSTRSSLDKQLDDLRDKRLLPIDAEKVSSFELTAGKQEIEFAKTGDKWQILKPQPMRADNAQVDELVRKFTDAKPLPVSGESDKQAASAFASGSPVLTVKLTGDAGAQELQLRNVKDDYYAKSSEVDGVSKVAKDLADAAGKKPDDFRNKKLFDFGTSDPDKIAIQDAGKSWFLTHGGEDWWSGEGKKLDSEGVFSVLDKLRDLQATGFVDSGFGTPVIDITVASDGGRVTEKVLISQSGDHYLAKREGEATLYSLDAKVVDELRKSIGEVKPAVAGAK